MFGAPRRHDGDLGRAWIALTADAGRARRRRSADRFSFCLQPPRSVRPRALWLVPDAHIHFRYLAGRSDRCRCVPDAPYAPRIPARHRRAACRVSLCGNHAAEWDWPSRGVGLFRTLDARRDHCAIASRRVDLVVLRRAEGVGLAGRASSAPTTTNISGGFPWRRLHHKRAEQGRPNGAAPAGSRGAACATNGPSKAGPTVLHRRVPVAPPAPQTGRARPAQRCCTGGFSWRRLHHKRAEQGRPNGAAPAGSRGAACATNGPSKAGPTVLHRRVLVAPPAPQTGRARPTQRCCTGGFPWRRLHHKRAEQGRPNGAAPAGSRGAACTTNGPSKAGPTVLHRRVPVAPPAPQTGRARPAQRCCTGGFSWRRLRHKRAEQGRPNGAAPAGPRRGGACSAQGLLRRRHRPPAGRASSAPTNGINGRYAASNAVPVPRRNVTSRSARMPVQRSRRPSGHWTMTASTPGDEPSPKCTRTSLADR